jgi:hypothetical protein
MHMKILKWVIIIAGYETYIYVRLHVFMLVWCVGINM